MTYKPAVNDYVKWKTNEGWVYYVDAMGDYFTIEISVKDKPHCEYTKEHKHKKFHCCLVCPALYWNEVEYIGKRTSVYETEAPKVSQ
tara:strand:+ start:1138 stop:1398 length:261 start_codon:yes stop_codon:yes gene_type:complete